MQQRKLTFVIPGYNAEDNLQKLVASLKSQRDKDWQAIMIDDCSDDGGGLWREACDVHEGDKRFNAISNEKWGRKYALRTIVETCYEYVKDGIVAIIDGDDQLCNDDTVSLIKAAHDEPGVVAWTAHGWDINGMNISKEMPANVDPYSWPWCSSHLKTFDAELLKRIPESNFKDHKGNWFERGYDQALMLPLLSVCKKRKYIHDVCYLYNINSVSIDNRDWAEKKQLGTINFVRARGFLSK